MSGNPLNPLTHLDVPNDKWYSFLIKPIIMIFTIVVFSFISLWLGAHYVTNERFGEYVDKQLKSDVRQDEDSKARFEITQQKLETIINQQVSYTEQLKANNQIMFSIQKQVDNLDNRIIYLERNTHNNISK
jgi:hypothetical protein